MFRAPSICRSWESTFIPFPHQSGRPHAKQLKEDSISVPPRFLVPNPCQLSRGLSPGSKPLTSCLAFHIPATSGWGI